MTKNNPIFLYRKIGEQDVIVYVLARGVDLKGETHITFTEIGSGKNVVMSEYLFEKNYIPLPL